MFKLIVNGKEKKPKDSPPEEVKEPTPDCMKDAVKFLIGGLLSDGEDEKQKALESAFRSLCTDEYVDAAKAELLWDDGERT